MQKSLKRIGTKGRHEKHMGYDEENSVKSH